MKLLLACAVCLLLSGCGGGGGGDSNPQPTQPPVQPQPLGPSRKGLGVTFFGGSGDDVLPEVTIRFLPPWGVDTPEGIVDAFKRTLAGGVKDAILSFSLFNPGSPRSTYKGAEVAKPYVRAIFQALRDAELLGMVKILYPVDEPERDANIAESDIVQCNTDLCAVAAEFPELAAVRLMVIYGDHEDYRGLKSFRGPGGGIIGVDSYDQGDKILSGIYSRLKPQLEPDQTLALVVGGADPWRTDPWPFYVYAQDNQDVSLIVAFVFDDQWGGTQNLGIKSNGMRPRFSSIAAAIKQGALA